MYWNWGTNSPLQVNSFIVERIFGDVSGDTQVSPLKLDVWGIDFDCRFVGRARGTHTVHPFDGEKPIQELAMYPARFHKDDLKNPDMLPRKEQFEKNGKEFFHYCKGNGHYMMLKGGPFKAQIQKPVIHCRVMVDQEQYFNEYPRSKPKLMANNDDSDSDSDVEGSHDTGSRTGCRCIHCGKKSRRRKVRDWTKFDNIAPGESPEIDDSLFYRLCDVMVPAYLLQDRKWAPFVHVSELHEVTFDENVLDSLVLPPEIKSTVQALAWNASQKTPDSRGSGLIGGKGNGQILLLHGAPGVGKTATAGEASISNGIPKTS